MCRLMTPQLEEALKGYPLYSQDGKGKEAVCRAIFALGAVRWFILEGEKEGNDTILYGNTAIYHLTNCRKWNLTLRHKAWVSYK